MTHLIFCRKTTGSCILFLLCTLSNILASAVEQLWCAIPARCHLMTVEAIFFSSEHPRQAKIGQLQMSTGADQQVCRLQISVHDVILMAKSHTVQKHCHVAFDLSFSEWAFCVSQNHRQIGEHELEGKHDTRAVGKHIKKFHDVVMLADLLQRFDFSQCCVGDATFQPSNGHLFQRHQLACFKLLRFEHDTVGSLSDPSQIPVFFHWLAATKSWQVSRMYRISTWIMETAPLSVWAGHQQGFDLASTNSANSLHWHDIADNKVSEYKPAKVVLTDLPCTFVACAHVYLPHASNAKTGRSTDAQPTLSDSLTELAGSPMTTRWLLGRRQRRR